MLGRLLGRGTARGGKAGHVPQVDKSERIYAVGDVHGRIDLLKAMLKRLAVDILEQEGDGRTPRIIFLGDYVDRGDNSREVVETLMACKGSDPEKRMNFLIGNHEVALLNFLKDPVGKCDWLGYGGLQTLSSYGVSLPATHDGEELRRVAKNLRGAMGSHIAFLLGFKRYIRSGDVVFAHAGIEPWVALEDQEDKALLWGRSSFIELGGQPGLRVVHGHYDAIEPVQTPARVCVDTGAYYSGKLTAIRLDAGEELIVVDVMDID